MSLRPKRGKRSLLILDSFPAAAYHEECGESRIVVPVMKIRSGSAWAELVRFYESMGSDGVRDYWRRKNVQTIDGTPTGIIDDL